LRVPLHLRKSSLWPRLLPLLASLGMFAATALGSAAQTVPQRPLTDAQSVRSLENALAGPVPIQDLLFSRTVLEPAWSPDGKQIVFTTNFTGRLNLWKVSAAGGWPIQLVQGDDRQLGPTWSPDGKWIFYQQDAGGNELYQIYRVPADGGDPVNITKAPEVRFLNFHISPDGKFIASGMKPKNAASTDIAILNLADGSVRNLTNEKSPQFWWPNCLWSADGKTIYATRESTSLSDSSVYRIDVRSGKIEELTPHTGDVLISVSSASPDGRTLLLSSNGRGGVSNVALFDLVTHKMHWVTDSMWEASSGDFSPDNRHFTYVINADGRTETYIGDREGAPRKLAFPDGITGFSGNPTAYSRDGEHLLLIHEASNHPSELWVYDLLTGGARQISHSAIASLNSATLPASQLIHYKSFDGETISAFLWMPFNLKKDGSNPAVVLPHGGPTDQTVDRFNATAAALASRGYICIAPNVRGSTGYGAVFQKQNYQDLGGGDLQDEVYATRFLLATGYVDAKKIGITGGSYGGFMTLMAVAKTPEIWAAGAEQYGIVNWTTMVEKSEPFLQSYVRSILGDPEKDAAIYRAASPLTYMKNAAAPLLVLQGENDIRVPKEEAEQVVKIYQANGKTVEAKFYPQEGHGYSKREDQVDSLRRVIDWFDRYLKGTSEGSGSADSRVQ
jgi:dipeptidyl aminopeptidase/acylaminoacyl peptidase